MGSTEASSARNAGWRDLMGRRYGAYTLMITLGTCLFAVDTFIIATVMPSVVADIGGMRFYAWSFSLFSVGAIIGAASTGPLRDAIGRRWTLVGAGILFLIGILGAAMAPVMIVLVISRLLQGIGGGAILSNGYGLVGEVFPPEMRGRILAVVSTTWGVATMFGPAVGGVFAELGLWRGAFWAIAPFLVLYAIMAYKIVPKTEAHGDLSALPFKRLALLALAILFLSGTSQVEENVWRGLLIVLSAATAFLAFRRDRAAEHRMFPRDALVITSPIGGTYWLVLIVSVVFTVVNVYATLYLQVLHDSPPIVAAYLYALLSISWTIGSLIVAPWQEGRAPLAIFIGLVLMVIGSIGLALTVVQGPVYLIATSTTLIGLGLGFSNNPLITQAIAVVDDDEKGLAGSSFQSMRTIGISFGAAAAGLLAAMAGLTEAADPAAVARAMQWVYRVDVVLALIGLAMAARLLARSSSTPALE